MHRVLVIGSGGAGKSTFARRLAQCTGLPLIHLDAIYWRPGWIETPKEEWVQTVKSFLAAEHWVMDGNYGGTLEQRLTVCDAVVFLDLPRSVCLWRATMRRIRSRGRSRPDMREGCPDRLTWDFIRWIWRYPVERRPQILERLSRLESSHRIFVLRSKAEVEEFFHNLSHHLE
jgi:adenylate kinase family enzyme